MLAWFLLPSGETVPSPDELAEAALTASAEDLQEEAALSLARHQAKPVELLRKVLSKTSSDRVRAAAVSSLGNVGDWESMPQLIEAMRSDNAHLRGRAYAASYWILHQKFGTFPANSEPIREATIKKIEAEWPILYEGHKIKKRLLEAGEQPTPNLNDPTDKKPST